MRFRNVGQYKVGGTGTRMELAIPLPKTPDGRVYRFSPNENAHPRHFVLGGRDDAITATDEIRGRMRIAPGSDQTVCPYSGVVGEQQDFTHPDDVTAARSVMEHAVMADVKAELSAMLKGMARNSGGAIRFEAGRSPAKPKPRFSRSDLMRELVCDHCGQDYGVYAIGLFCPGCGAPNLRLHFAREVELVLTQVELAETQATASEELAYRLLGNAHEDVLTAFEATLKTVYVFGVVERTGAAPAKPPQNDFQNIEKARKRYGELDIDPFAGLGARELAVLKLNIQKRHVIGHNLGVVDAKFAEHASDARVGETVALVGADIRNFATLAQKVVDQLDAWLTGEAVLPAVEDAPPEPSAVSSPPEQDNDLGIGALAYSLGMWVADRAANGMCDPIGVEDITAAFPDHNSADLAEAVADLKGFGYVDTSGVIGAWLDELSPRLDLFIDFDRRAGREDPNQAAVLLADELLKRGPADSSVNVPEFYAQLGWPLRRFNLALGILLADVGFANVSDELFSGHPTRSFHVLPDERFHLKRFAERLRR